jgi:FMN-dependent NADH-azoreductase
LTPGRDAGADVRRGAAPGRAPTPSPTPAPTPPTSRVLVVNASPMLGGSTTRALTAHTAWKLALDDDAIDVRYRDVGTEPPPHLDHAAIEAFRTAAAARTAAQAATVATADALTREVVEAGTLVLGVPLHNFGIPSPLKAWLDQVLRQGVTWQPTADGARSLMAGKTAFVLTAATDAASPCAGGGCPEQIRPALEAALRLLGVETLHFVHAGDQALGGAPAARGRDDAIWRIDRLTESPTLRRAA